MGRSPAGISQRIAWTSGSKAGASRASTTGAKLAALTGICGPASGGDALAVCGQTHQLPGTIFERRGGQAHPLSTPPDAKVRGQAFPVTRTPTAQRGFEPGGNMFKQCSWRPVRKWTGTRLAPRLRLFGPARISGDFGDGPQTVEPTYQGRRRGIATGRHAVWAETARACNRRSRRSPPSRRSVSTGPPATGSHRRLGIRRCHLEAPRDFSNYFDAWRCQPLLAGRQWIPTVIATHASNDVAPYV